MRYKKLIHKTNYFWILIFSLILRWNNKEDQLHYWWTMPYLSMLSYICLTALFLILLSVISCRWEPVQRQRMKVEKSLQTSSTQTAKSWPNCLKLAVCDFGPQIDQEERTTTKKTWRSLVATIFNIIQCQTNLGRNNMAAASSGSCWGRWWRFCL